MSTISSTHMQESDLSLSTAQHIPSVVQQIQTVFGLESVLVADTQETRVQGLSDKPSLGEREGMLFVFEEEGNYGFWMKDMLFAIDIVWIGKDGDIVHIERAVLPDTYPSVFNPPVKALYVLEVNGGGAGNIEVGQKVFTLL